MSENKVEIQYILKFYYKKKMRVRLLKKFVMFMIQYQYVWYKTGSSVFNLENLMSKMHLALVDQSLEKSMKSWKKLSKIGTLAVMISIKN